MNNLDKLESQVKEMQAEIERLKALPSQIEGIVWRPEKGEDYYFDGHSLVASHTWADDGADNRIFNARTLYKTEGEAQLAVDITLAKIRVLRRVAELNRQANWVCDWDDRHQRKFRVMFDRLDSTLSLSSSHFISAIPTNQYASENLWEQIIREMEEDVKLGLFGISS